MHGIKQDERLLNEIEVSEILNVSVDTLRSWRKKNKKDGNLPFIKVGKKLVRYKLSEIENFLNKSNMQAG